MGLKYVPKIFQIVSVGVVKMAGYYEWFKVIHLIALISWMAGLLYLPRLYVYHSSVKIGSDSDEMLKNMEHRLLRYIMNPAMIVTFIFGIILAFIYGFQALGMWFHLKMLFVIILSVFHSLLSRWRRDFFHGKNKHSEKFYRIINEVPAVLMIFIVIMVIIKPFD